MKHVNVGDAQRQLQTLSLNEVRVTEEHLNVIRQYIYNIICGCNDDVPQEVLKDEVFTEQDIMSCVHRGLQRYEQLHTRSIVCDTRSKYKLLNKYNELPISDSTKTNEYAARIVSLFFKPQNSQYVSECIVNNEVKTFYIDAHKFANETGSMDPCRRCEESIYYYLFCESDEYIVTLCFLYSLGIQM